MTRRGFLTLLLMPVVAPAGLVLRPPPPPDVITGLSGTSSRGRPAKSVTFYKDTFPRP